MPVRVDTGTGAPVTVIQSGPDKGKLSTQGHHYGPAPTPSSPSGYDVDQFNAISRQAAQDLLMHGATVGPTAFAQITHHMMTSEGLQNTGDVQIPTTTHLLLRQQGYVGNSTKDLEAQVQRINDAFTAAGYTQGPTPGLILDMLKARTGYGHVQLDRAVSGLKALQALGNGTLGEVAGQGNIAGHAYGQTLQPLTADEQKQQQLKDILGTVITSNWMVRKNGKTKDVQEGGPTVADVSNIYAGQQGVDFAQEQLSDPKTMDVGATASVLAGTAPIRSTDAYNIALMAKQLSQVGIDYSTLSGTPAEIRRQVEQAFKTHHVANQQRFGGAYEATEATRALSAIDATKAVQRNIIKTFPQVAGDASATGILNGAWPSILKNLQGHMGYQKITELTAAQAAGFGDGKFDAYSSVNLATGKITSAAAAQYLAKWHGAMNLKQQAIEAHPYGKVMWESVPLGMFQRGGSTGPTYYGLSIDSVGGYLLGGADHDYFWQNPGFSLNGGILNTGEALLHGAHNITETMIRTGTLMFDVPTGIYNQGKLDLFGAVALIPRGYRLNSKDSGLEGIPLIGKELSHGLTAAVNNSLSPILQPYATPNTSISTRWQMAQDRIKSGEIPTWLQISYNNEHAQQIMAHQLEMTGIPGYMARPIASVTDFSSNLAVDFMLTKDVGLGAFGKLTGGPAMMRTLGNTERAAVWMGRNSQATAAINWANKMWKDGKYAQGSSKFGVLNDSPMHDRNIFQDEAGGWHFIEDTSPHAPAGGAHVPSHLGPGEADPLGQSPLKPEITTPEVYKPGEPAATEPLTESQPPPVPADHQTDLANVNVKAGKTELKESIDRLTDPTKVRALDNSGTLDREMNAILQRPDVPWKVVTDAETGAKRVVHRLPDGNVYVRTVMDDGKLSVKEMQMHATEYYNRMKQVVEEAMPGHSHVYHPEGKPLNGNFNDLNYRSIGKGKGEPLRITVSHEPIRDEATYLAALHEIAHLGQVPGMGQDYLKAINADSRVLSHFPLKSSGHAGHINFEQTAEEMGLVGSKNVELYPALGHELDHVRSEILNDLELQASESHAWADAFKEARGLPSKSAIKTMRGYRKTYHTLNQTYQKYGHIIGHDPYHDEMDALMTAAEKRAVQKEAERGVVHVRVKPSGRAYIAHLDTASRLTSAGADRLALHALQDAIDRGATRIVAHPAGMNDVEKSVFERVVANARKLEGDRISVGAGKPEFHYDSQAGKWFHEGGGEITIKPEVPELEDAVVEAEQGAAATLEDTHFPLSDTAELKGALAMNPDGPKLYNIMEARHAGAPESFVADWGARNVAKGRLFHNQAAGTPARSVRLFDPGLSWSHPTAVIPHPLRFARNGFGAAFQSTANGLTRAFPASRVPGGNMLGSMVREFHVLFDRAANGNSLPVTEYDPMNIVRAGRTLGLSEEYSQLLGSLFSKARYEENGALLRKVQNTLIQAGIAQGRSFKSTLDLAQAFSATTDRSLEHTLYKDASTLLHEDGPIANRQWVTISAHQDGMDEATSLEAHRQLKEDVRALGLEPIEAKGVWQGGEERSILVPGLRQHEALDLGAKYKQHSVMTGKGLLHTANGDENSPLFGQLQPLVEEKVPLGVSGRAGQVAHGEGAKAFRMRRKPPRKLTAQEAATTDHTEVVVKGKTIRFSMDVQPGFDTSGHALSSLPHGEAVLSNQANFIAAELARLGPDADPHEVARLQEMLATASHDQTPELTSQMFHNFAIPILHVGRSGGFLGLLNEINGYGLRVSQIHRRLLLGLNPMLFWKHSSADTARRIIGMADAPGGYKSLVNKADRKALAEFHARNPRAKALADETAWKNKTGELRYDTNDAGVGDSAPSSVEGFMTGPHNTKAQRAEAAAYFHHRVMDGAYGAWVKGNESGGNGIDAVINFYETDARGMKLAKEQGMPPELMGRMVGQNLETIVAHDPNFLSDLSLVAEKAKPGAIRKDMEKWLKENDDRSVPVTGHASAADLHNLTTMQKLDSASSNLIGLYMTANKLNKGGMFHDILASAFKAMKDAGLEENLAHENAVGIANQAVKFHLLDLADALKVEQNFRWADYFFTKHRLYWSWLYSTMANHPEYSIAVKDLQNAMSQTDNDRGQMTINLGHLGGIGDKLNLAGGELKYTIPLARLFWLDTTSSTMPGPISIAAADLMSGNFDQALPFMQRSNIDATTMDTAIKYGAMLLTQKLGGHNKTSAEVESHLNPIDAYKFKQSYWRIYVGGLHDGAWKGLTGAEIDERVTHTAMVDQFITGGWRRSGFTGGYAEDPRMTTQEEKIWAKYNNEIDPAKRAALREQFPFIKGQLGMYNSTAQQHKKSAALWDTYNKMITQHHRNQNALLAKFKQTGNVADLFGGPWRQESARFQEQYADFQKEAAAIGGSDFLKQSLNDRMMPAYSALAGQLHKLFPLYTQEQINNVVGKQKMYAQRAFADEKALNGQYSRKSIEALPEDFQQTAYRIRAYYATDVSQLASDPAHLDTAENVRRRYFEKVYGPYLGHVNDLYANIDKSTDIGQQFDAIREYQDAHNHPVKLNGIEYPGPEEMAWIMLPHDAQMAKRADLVQKPWNYLTQFQKGVLGVHVSKDVQAGWKLYNDSYYGAKERYSKTHAGQQLYLDDGDKLYIAKHVEMQHPGFMKDFIHSQTPVWARLQQHPNIFFDGKPLKPKAAKDWKALLDWVGANSNGWAGSGSHLPKTAADLLAYNKVIRGEQVQQLLLKGWAGADKGIPVATGPTKQYPTGGLIYRWVKTMDPTVFNAVKHQLALDPNFLATLFAVGS